jgi:WXG100 family type VII secretion target
MFPGFQFIAQQVQDVSSTVKQQQQITQGVLDQVKSYPSKVQGAWIGGDADEFAADVARKLVPAMMELIAAIAGININLGKAIQTVQQADQKVRKLADGLGDVFSKI